MVRRLVSVLALAAFALGTPALAASAKAKGKKPAATKSAKAPGKKKPKKTAAKAKPAATPAPAAAIAPAAAHRPDPSGRAFIRTQRAGWQEVVVGNRVVATRANGSKVTGTIKEVSDFAIVIEPKTSSRVTIAASDLNQVFAAH